MEASTSQKSFESSGSDSDEQERNKKRFKNIQRRANRPQKYKVEWESETAFKGWLKPVKGMFKDKIISKFTWFWCLLILDNALKAKCIACNSEFLADISVIRCHSKGAKHGKLVQILRPSQPKIDVSFSKCNDQRRKN